MLYRSAVVKRELSGKIYLLIYVHTLTCVHKLCLVIKRMRLQMQVMTMSFICRVSGISLDHSEGTRKNHYSFKLKGASQSWVRHLTRTPTFRHVQLGGDSKADPRDTGEITFLSCLGNASQSPWKICKRWLEKAIFFQQ